jgi:hypothetical protein
MYHRDRVNSTKKNPERTSWTSTARARAAGLDVLGRGAFAGTLSCRPGTARAARTLDGVLLGGFFAVAVEGVVLAAGAGGLLGGYRKQILVRNVQMEGQNVVSVGLCIRQYCFVWKIC